MKKWAYCLISIFVCTLFLALGKTILSLTHPIKYEKVIIDNANVYNISPSIIASVINVESGYNKNARSNKNALGLMQIKQDTVTYLINYYNLNISINDLDLFDAETNIRFGCMYLNYLLKKFNNTNTALAAYNAGETKVRSWLKNKTYSTDGIILNNIPYKETALYIKKFEKNLKFYKKYYKN